MNETEKSGTAIGAAALIGLFLISSFSYIMTGSETITGAVTGESYVFEMCLKKYGHDSDGNLDYEKIKDCRNAVQTLEKARGNGDNKGTPRLYLSSDRSAYQNTKTVE